MKLRSQDRDYVVSENIRNQYNKLWGKGYTSPYSHTERKYYTDEKGITQYTLSSSETFDILEDGLCKCQKCYSLMIPVIEDGILKFYNLDNGKCHYNATKKQNDYHHRGKYRKGREWLCQM